MIITAITNAFWAESPEKAKAILGQIPEIERLEISKDKYHLKNIPFERVKNAITAAEGDNREYSVILSTVSKEDEDYNKLVKKLLRITSRENINTTVTYPSGRASSIPETKTFSKSLTPPVGACISAGSPVIFPNGDVIGCIDPVINISKDHPLKYGNLFNQSLENILNSAQKNVVLHTIRIWGPHKLVSMIQDSEYKKYLPKEYTHSYICDACCKLLNNDQLCPFFDVLQYDQEYMEMIAYARVYYLKETQLAEMMGLGQTAE